MFYLPINQTPVGVFSDVAADLKGRRISIGRFKTSEETHPEAAA